MAAATDKVRRQRAILDLIRKRAVASQEDLARGLRRQGFAVTQSTLSRDLRELKVLRVPVDEGYRYAVAESEMAAAGADSPRLRAVTSEEVLSIEANEVMVLVRTLAGRAPGVAAFLDSWSHADLLGTLAGDDTILVLPRSTSRSRRLERALAQLFGLAAPSERFARQRKA